MTIWDDVPELPEPATTPTVVDAGQTWHLLPENGWGALIGWLAGLDRLRRCPDIREHTTEVSIQHRDGTVTTAVHPRTAEDQAMVDESIGSYLRDAGIPPPPPGNRWYLRLPGGFDDLGALLRAINVPLSAHLVEPAPTPRQNADALRPIVAELYQG